MIVPTYNREELLRYTLTSLTLQSLPRDSFEVLVVDDGSSDGTAEMVDEYKKSLNLRYFFQEDEGFQVGKARNIGIRNAATPLCVFIDSGILLHSDCLKEHMATHVLSDDPVAVIGYTYGLDPTRADSEPVRQAVDFTDPDATIDRMKANGWLDVRELFYAKYSDDFHDEPAPWIVYWAGNVSASTEQLNAVGMFDEAFRSWGVEDVDLGYRLHRAGARIVLNRRASSTHYPHDTSFDSNMELAGHNFRYMAQKYGTPIVELLASTPPEQHFALNETIRELGIPRCQEFLAEQRAAHNIR